MRFDKALNRRDTGRGIFFKFSKLPYAPALMLAILAYEARYAGSAAEGGFVGIALTWSLSLSKCSRRGGHVVEYMPAEKMNLCKISY
ncbi:MAG: hypothetical protein HYZ24_14815 [Chloroflexi bacterium]|nr:hypothetical protein [Chloroflexota bacterium]